MFKNFSKLPMSKKLTIVVTWGFFISFAFTIFAYMRYDKDITFILQYMFYAFNVCLLAYMGKSGWENTSPNFKEMFKDAQCNANNQEGDNIG
jgi:hypothetical protein